MSTNLVSMGLRYVTPELLSKIASSLGVDKTAVGTAITAAFPAILGSLAGAAAKPGGATQLDRMVSKQNPGLLDELGAALGGSGQAEFIEGGQNSLKSLLGNTSASSLADAISRFAGIGKGATSSLLGLLVPAVLALLGQQKAEKGLDATGLSELLADQKDHIAAAMPSDFMDSFKGTDIPGFPAAKAEGIRKFAPAALALTGQGGQARPSVWTWLLPIAAVAALTWWLLSEPTTTAPEPATGQTSAVNEPVPSLAVDPTELGQVWDRAFTELRTALESVTDTTSAQAAVPKLVSATDELESLVNLSESLPADRRLVLADLVRAAQPTLEELYARIQSIPGAAQVADPAISAVREKCERLTQT